MRHDQGRKPTDADYGLGEHTIDCDQMGLIDDEAMTERLVRTFNAPNYHPPRLPTVAMELNALAAKPDVEFGDLEELLEQDAMLAGEVLSLSRSACYSGVRAVSSLREALIRLGLDKLREVVFQASMNTRVFRCEAYREQMERLRNHSRAMAHLCRLVSRYSPIGEETAFLCGLMHDVGIAGILLVLGDVPRDRKAPDLSPLWPAIDAAHAEAGARMVELWRLPAEVSMAVGAHHRVTIERQEHPIAAALCVAEALAVELGLGFDPGGDDELAFLGAIDRSDPATVERARRALALDDAALQLVRDSAEEWVRASAPPAAP